MSIPFGIKGPNPIWGIPAMLIFAIFESLLYFSMIYFDEGYLDCYSI
jgi:hypothetical protein